MARKDLSNGESQSAPRASSPSRIGTNVSLQLKSNEHKTSVKGWEVKSKKQEADKVRGETKVVGFHWRGSNQPPLAAGGRVKRYTVVQSP